MILDELRCISRYAALHHRFPQAFEFLLRPGLRNLPDGRHAIGGDDVFALVSRSNGRRREDAPLEIHRKFIDIQVVLAGGDQMGWKPLSACADPAGEYDVQKDIRFLRDQPDAWIPVGPGQFVIFFPDDAHAPLVSSGTIHKMVVKVRT